MTPTAVETPLRTPAIRWFGQEPLEGFGGSVLGRLPFCPSLLEVPSVSRIWSVTSARPCSRHRQKVWLQVNSGPKFERLSLFSKRPVKRPA